MNELTHEELDLISGAKGWLAQMFDDVDYIIGRLPGTYDRAVSATTDMMCRGTGNC